MSDAHNGTPTNAELARRVQELRETNATQWKALRAIDRDYQRISTELRALREEVHNYRDEARENYQGLLKKVDKLITHSETHQLQTKIDRTDTLVGVAKWLIATIIAGIVALGAWVSTGGGK